MNINGLSESYKKPSFVFITDILRVFNGETNFRITVNNTMLSLSSLKSRLHYYIIYCKSTVAFNSSIVKSFIYLCYLYTYLSGQFYRRYVTKQSTVTKTCCCKKCIRGLTE